jgi:triosephosphate isomerase
MVLKMASSLPRPLVFGNWKMHGSRAQAGALAGGLAARVRSAGLKGTLGLFPPAPYLAQVVEAAAGLPVVVGGQDCHAQAKGAHTGDIAAEMIADLGGTAVLVGHSERRRDHGETDAVVKSKAEAALRAGLLAVVCVGETEADRKAGRQNAVVEAQLAGSLPAAAPLEKLVVAYEPVWAIGTGLTATPDDIRAMHGFIHDWLERWRSGAGAVPILYGGSVKPANAAEILAVPHVGGLLVGGASLEEEGFWTIATAAG